MTLPGFFSEGRGGGVVFLGGAWVGLSRVMSMVTMLMILFRVPVALYVTALGLRERPAPTMCDDGVEVPHVSGGFRGNIGE